MNPPTQARAHTTIVLTLLPLVVLLVGAPWLRIGPLKAICLGFAATITTLQLAAHTWRREGLHWGLVIGRIVLGLALGVTGFFLAKGTAPEGLRSIVGGLCSTLSVLVVGLSLGSAIGQRVPAASHLLPVGLVSSAMDLWSALAPEGVTNTITSAPDPAWLRILTMNAPVVPSRALEPMLGFGDVVFAGLYLAAANKHQLSTRKMHVALAIAFALAGALVIVAARPLPALPFLALTVVIANPEARKVAVEDRKATAFSALLFVAAVARLLWLRA